MTGHVTGSQVRNHEASVTSHIWQQKQALNQVAEAQAVPLHEELIPAEPSGWLVDRREGRYSSPGSYG